MNTRRNTIYMVIVGAAMVAGLVFTNSGAIAKQLNDWHLLPKPEPYTLFYFNRPDQLPTKSVPGGEQSLDITVHNMQYEPTTYHYSISAVPFGGEPQIIKQGQCATAHQTTCTINDHFTLPALAPRMQVRIDLTYTGRSYDQPANTSQRQSLHYWVDITPPTGGIQ